jgi:hypothetical protein
MTTYSRQEFLKQALMGIAVATLSPFQRLMGNNSTQESILPKWADLIEYARWCPTVHNLQPHKIKVISATEAHLYYDPTRLLPHGDPDSIFATVAMGIFHEHLSISAAQNGYQVQMRNISGTISHRNTAITLFATLHLVPNTTPEPLDRQLILQRRTSRLKYNGRPMPDTLCAQMAEESARYGHEFFYSNDKKLVDTVIDLNQKTLFEDLKSKENCTELDHLFRYSQQEAQQHKDGLWAKCMNFPGKLVKTVFSHSEKWHKGLRHKLLANYYKNAFDGTTTLCWMGGHFEHEEDWLNAGRVFSRNWLMLTREQAFLQPFGSLITNKNAYQTINQKFTQPKENKKIWMIFRAGYSDEPARSYRLSTAEILI